MTDAALGAAMAAPPTAMTKQPQQDRRAVALLGVGGGRARPDRLAASVGSESPHEVGRRPPPLLRDPPPRRQNHTTAIVAPPPGLAVLVFLGYGCPARRSSTIATPWCGLEADPAHAFEPQLGPGVRVVRRDDPGAVVVLFAGGESDLHPGRDVKASGHQRHRRCELLAISAAVSQEVF